MVGRDPDHEYFCSIFPVENEPQQRRGISEMFQGLIGNTHSGMMTISKSFPSILKLFKGKDSCCSPLPDDVLLEILRRLPPERILICRMVCKRWMSLTSTPLFHGLHLKAAPVILLQHHLPCSQLKLYYLDLTPDEPRIGRFDTTKLQPNNRRCYYGGTCNGLVLLWRQEIFGTLLVSICNPLTGREIALPPTEADYYLGFWFHPIKRDYFFLTYSNGLEAGGGLVRRGFEYKIFNLRGQCTVIGWYAVLPSNNPPINISGSLYFFLHGARPCQNPNICIMIFNTESETMDFKAHPHYDHCRYGHGSKFGKNEDMCLLDVGGSLGFAHLCSTERSLHLWVLEECEWIPRYKININWNRSSLARICALNILQNSEMLMHFCYRSLFAFNLETRRIRKININVDGPESRIGIAGTYVSTFVDPGCLAILT